MTRLASPSTYCLTATIQSHMSFLLMNLNHVPIMGTLSLILTDFWGIKYFYIMGIQDLLLLLYFMLLLYFLLLPYFLIIMYFHVMG
jgi:hypothetical protein